MRTRVLFPCFVFLLLCTPRAGANTYTVMTRSGGNYTSIQDCADNAVAGDTCEVYAGVYNETISPKSGSAGKPVTFAVNPGDCVTVKGFSLGGASYVTIGTPNSPRCTSAPEETAP